MRKYILVVLSLIMIALRFTQYILKINHELVQSEMVLSQLLGFWLFRWF
ncbi:hypothetical protein [Sutcliffiella horikoshii]|nr:hypothetical protein [Sutcliffiella horikoshii]